MTILYINRTNNNKVNNKIKKMNRRINSKDNK